MSKPVVRTQLGFHALDNRDLPSLFAGVSLLGCGYTPPVCQPVAVHCQPVRSCDVTPPKSVVCAPTPPKKDDCAPTPPKPVEYAPKPVCTPTPPKPVDCVPKEDDGKCDLFGGNERRKDHDDKFEACGYGYKPKADENCDDKGTKAKKDNCASELVGALKAKVAATVSALCGVGAKW